jgi:L-ascorbate metabolism protein UlaG (beta-lactamase superfamily)
MRRNARRWGGQDHNEGPAMNRLRALILASAVVALAGCANSPLMQPAPALQALPADAPHEAGKTEVLWLGQAATRIVTPGGKVIMIDPWLTSNPKTPPAFKQLSALGHVDLILVTHAHFDHFADAPALARLNNAPVYGPAGLDDTIVKLGILPVELAPRFGKGGTILPWGPSGPKITAVHAEHSSELTWKDANGKEMIYPGGEPVGFIIEMENGLKVWHMGDTAVFGDMRLIADMYHPDVVLMPIGNHFVMSPQDAAMAVRDMIRPRYAIPIHYGTTPQLRGTPAELLQAMGTATVPRILVPEPGQKYEF